MDRRLWMRRDLLRTMAQVMTYGAAWGLLSGCGTPAGSSGGPGSASPTSPATPPPAPKNTGKLSLLLGSHMNYLHALAADYEMKFGVKPQVEQITTPDLRTKLVAAFAARRSAWDSVFLTAALVREMAQNNWVKDATARAEKALAGKKVPERAFTSALYKGKKWALPVTIGAPILHWNKELLQKVGLDPEAPAKWHSQKNSYDEFLRYAKQLTRTIDGVQVYGYTDAWGGAGIMQWFRAVVQMHAGKVLDDDGNPVFNGPAGVAAVEKMYDLLHTHKVVDPAVTTYTWVFDASPGFLNGQRGMFMTWPFIADVAEDATKSKIVGKAGFAPNFAVDTSASVDGSEFLAVPAAAENEEEGWRFLELAVSPEAQRKQGTTTGWIPIYEDLLSDKDVVAKQRAAPVVALSYKYPVDNYFTPDYAKWSEITSVELQEVLQKKKKPKEALDDAVKKINEERKR